MGKKSPTHLLKIASLLIYIVAFVLLIIGAVVWMQSY